MQLVIPRHTHSLHHRQFTRGDGHHQSISLDMSYAPGSASQPSEDVTQLGHANCLRVHCKIAKRPHSGIIEAASDLDVVNHILVTVRKVKC